MSEKTSPETVAGKVRAYLDRGKSGYVQVDFYFGDKKDLIEILQRLEADDRWSLMPKNVNSLPEISLIPKPDDYPYFCPIHGNKAVMPNKKKGDHTHYCAFKLSEGKWCGHKIYRFE